MENEHQLELPEILLPFKEKILATLQHFIEIIPTEEKVLKPWQSTFGGNPYLPLESTFPTTPDGKALFFLGQINFGEAPPLAPFPETGIIQFFIFDDQKFGLDSEDLFHKSVLEWSIFLRSSKMRVNYNPIFLFYESTGIYRSIQASPLEWNLA
jgi:uncharacterized protein YwqG